MIFLMCISVIYGASVPTQHTALDQMEEFSEPECEPGAEWLPCTFEEIRVIESCQHTGYTTLSECFVTSLQTEAIQEITYQVSCQPPHIFGNLFVFVCCNIGLFVVLLFRWKAKKNLKDFAFREKLKKIIKT